MRTLVVVAIALFVPVSVRAQDADPPPVIDETWVPLFDGSSLVGWDVPFAEFWTVEDGTIHGRMPAGATWDERASRGKWTWIKTARTYRQFHIALEVRVGRGQFAIVQWGTLKQFLSAGYLGEGWHDVRMTWRGGDVRLWVDGNAFAARPEARSGDNVREIYLLLSPDSEAWFRNVRLKELEVAGEVPAKGPDDPRPAALAEEGLPGWKVEGDWSWDSSRVVGRAGREAIRMRTEGRAFDRGDLVFEYRGGAGANEFVVLVDVSTDGRQSIRIALPPAGRGWKEAKIELRERELVLVTDGAPAQKARRTRAEGGIAFVLAAGADVEIRRLRFEPVR